MSVPVPAPVSASASVPDTSTTTLPDASWLIFLYREQMSTPQNTVEDGIQEVQETKEVPRVVQEVGLDSGAARSCMPTGGFFGLLFGRRPAPVARGLAIAPRKLSTDAQDAANRFGI